MGSSALTFFGSIAVSGALLASPAPDPSVRCSVVEVHPAVASRTASTSTSNATSDIDFSERWPYQTDTGSYVLHRFTGRYVAVFLPDEWLGSLSVEDRRILIDRLDLIYETYKAMLGKEPAGDGLLPIYFVALDGGLGGRASIGRKWIEFSSAADNLTRTRNEIRNGGVLDELYFHEMAHNFDFFSDYLPNFFDHSTHTWTALIVPFAQIYGGSGDELFNAPQIVRDRWSRFYQEYLNEPGATWTRCVRDSTCTTPPIWAWGGVTYRVAELHGIEAFLRFLTSMKEIASRSPFPLTPEQQEDVHVEALAAATQQDLSCYVDYWRWYASSDLRERMRIAYGPNRFCQDQDGDGFSPLKGDCHDDNPLIHPGAADVRNGIDDDCDGVTDNLVYQDNGVHFPDPLLVSYPAKIQGMLSGADDRDRIQFFLSSSLAVRISPWPRSRFTFDCRILNGNQVVATVPGFDHHVVNLAAGTSTIEIYPSLSPGPLPPPPNAPPPPPVTGGSYEISLRDAEPRGWEWGVVEPSSPTAGSIRLVARTRTLAGIDRPPTDVRFWVTKFGFVGSVPYSANAIFDWKIPPDVAAGTYGYRAQLFSGSLPVSDVTPAVWFQVQTTRSRVARHGS